VISALVMSSCAPKIISFVPKEGREGTEVTIKGERFKPTAADNTVRFGSVQATQILSAAANQLVAKVPANAKTGLISVRTNNGTGNSDRNFIISEGAKWTLMVYLDADNNLESAGLDDFLEMAAVGSSKNINIVVQMDRTPGYSSSYGDWRGTRRFLVGKNDTPSMTPLADLGEQNMGDPTTLRDFVIWAVQTYPAQRYALSIWNHGSGWRDALSRSEQRSSRSRGQEPSILRTVATDDTDGDVLYMSEVQAALQAAKDRLEERSTTIVKLDVVGFDACLMGMVEVAYALRNVANYVTGSEWVEPGDGWPYDTILAELAGTPTFDGADLSGVIVTKYGLYYNNGITQAAVDISKIDNVAAKIDAFVQSMNTEWAALKRARDNSICYHPSGFLSCWGVDLWDFADKVQGEVTSSTIKNVATELKKAIDEYIVNEHHSDDQNGSHGVAIYFPPTQADFNNDPDHAGYLQNNTTFPVDFVILHQWDQFLQTFYANTTS
jgi:hypothetical protein